MTIYEVVPNEGEIYAVSLIGDDETPANDFTIENGGFVALSDKQKYEVKFANSDDKLKTVYGIVLRADQLITRKIDGEICQMKFTAEAIREHANNYMIKQNTNMSSWNHDDEWLSGVNTVECWVVESDDCDKAYAIGLKAKKNDWILGMKLSDEKYEEYVESGRIKGFSIDSFLDLKRVNMKKIDIQQTQVENINKENVVLNDSLNKNNKKKMSVKNLLNLFSSKQVSTKRVINLASIEVDGVEFLSDDDFAEKTLVYTIGEDDAKVPVSEKTFEVDGFTIVTDADGIIESRTEIVSADLSDDVDKEDEVKMKKQKQTLSGELGAYIELPVGINTLADGTVVTVEEVTEGEGEDTWTYNSIVSFVPKEDAVANEELEKVKEELKKVKEQFSAREIELGALEAKNAVKIDLKSMSALERFRYYKNN